MPISYLLFCFTYFREEVSKFLIEKCDAFVMGNMKKYFTLVQNRIELEKEVEDSATLVKALNKFYRKLQTAKVFTPRADFSS